MNKILEQKRGPNLRRFLLKEDRILVETKSLSKNEKYEVMLDTLGTSISYKADSTLLGKIFFCCCLIILLAMTIAYLFAEVESEILIFNYVLWFGMAIFSYFKKGQDDVFLAGGPNVLVFYRTIPNEVEVSNFINEIITTSKRYMKNKYAKADADIPNDIFFARLNWLKEKDIISENEYSEIKKEYELKKLI